MFQNWLSASILNLRERTLKSRCCSIFFQNLISLHILKLHYWYIYCKVLWYWWWVWSIISFFARLWFLDSCIILEIVLLPKAKIPTPPKHTHTHIHSFTHRPANPMHRHVLSLKIPSSVAAFVHSPVEELPLLHLQLLVQLLFSLSDYKHQVARTEFFLLYPLNLTSSLFYRKPLKK